MRLHHVNFEISISVERLRTNAAGVRVRIRMHGLRVHVQCGRIVEFLLAKVAGIGSNAIVSIHMRFQVVLVSKTSITFGTFESLFLVVNGANVLGQTKFRAELISARDAQELSSALVDVGDQMLSNFILRIEAF